MPRKLTITPHTPGEPIQEAETPEQLEATETATAGDPLAVPLPEASEIDAKTITKPVLTKQGYIVPEK